MKILLASNPEASTPAMYTPGTFVSIVRRVPRDAAGLIHRQRRPIGSSERSAV